MRNPKLIEAIKVASKASYSAWHSAYSAYSVYVSVPGSASYSSKLDKEAVLKIIKDKYEKSKIS